MQTDGAALLAARPDLSAGLYGFASGARTGAAGLN